MSMENFIEECLKSGKGARIETTSEEFIKVRHLLEAKGVKYSYNPRTKVLRFTMPTLMHGSSVSWLAEWLGTLMAEKVINKRALRFHADVTLEGFEGEFAGLTKRPDGLLWPTDRKWPTITLEVGYTEDYPDLLADADLLLEGTNGEIGLVILVKVTPLQGNETAIKEGFLEVWSFNDEKSKKTERVREMV